MINNNTTLKFGAGNAKLSTGIATFSLPAGHSCPFAKECLSKADKLTGKIIDGKHCQFRCFAASQECAYPSVRQSRWNNFEIIRNTSGVQRLTRLLNAAVPQTFGHVRVHVSGDFFSAKYFEAWLNVARSNPHQIFYGYTKAIPFLVDYKRFIPKNFRFTASRGGTCDALIDKHKLRSAEVVFSVNEAKQRGLEIDHDDSHAIIGEKSFALLIHGTQPAGSEASKAWEKVKHSIGGYSRDSKRQGMVKKKNAVVYINFGKAKPGTFRPKYANA